MTNEEKKLIDGLRAEGLGYRKIAVRIGISENTVKSYLRKVEATETKDTAPAPTAGDAAESHICLYCGKPVAQNPGRKQKKFCSDACRNQWWNNHQDLVRRNAVYHFICPACGKDFSAYGNAHRKYCSHACYIDHRFGGAQ